MLLFTQSPFLLLLNCSFVLHALCSLLCLSCASPYITLSACDCSFLLLTQHLMLHSTLPQQQYTCRCISWPVTLCTAVLFHLHCLHCSLSAHLYTGTALPRSGCKREASRPVFPSCEPIATRTHAATKGISIPPCIMLHRFLQGHAAKSCCADEQADLDTDCMFQG